MRANQAKFSDLVNAGVSKNIGKERHKATQIRKGTKQVKENPVMYCSGSNTNKESLVNSCESDTIVSAASSSQTNQTEAFDTFIAWKVNPSTDSESATNYSQSFLPTPTRFIQQTTFHPEFNVNLNNNVSTLSTPFSQSLSTINSNLSEPERFFTTTSQQNPVMSSNSLVSLQPTPYLDPLPGQSFVALLDFVPPKTQSCFGCSRHLRKYTTDKNICLLENGRGLVFVTKSRRPMHKDH